MRPWKHAALATATVVLSCAPPAVAQTEGGVTVDPQSPAGKEYALPIEQARRDATGTKTPGGTDPAPAFGAGVEPDTSAAPRQPATNPAPSQPTGQKKATTAADRGGQAPSTTQVRAASRDVDRELVKAGVGNDVGGSSLGLVLGGIALAVVGAAAGLLVRHRTT